jgi:hypothetical protein
MAAGSIAIADCGAMPSSAAVKTATTPGAAVAVDTSTDRSLAWAIVERSRVRCSAPSSSGSRRSSL